MSDLERRFRDLLDAQGARVWKLCGAYARTEADREDLYQEVLVALWRALPAFRGEASERTWATRVALNVALSAVRRRGARPAAETPAAAEAVPSPEADPAQALADRDQLARLYAALDRLAPADRTLVLLALDGEPHRAIAETLGLSEANVAVRLHRLRRRLAALLADPAPTPP